MQLAHVTINEASALSSRHGKPCNPFCVILFNQGERRETEKRKNEGNPKWNFTFPCSLNLASAVPVVDVQVFSDKELLGQVSFFLRCPLPKGPQWYPLGTLPGSNEQVTQGRLRLSITVPWEKQISFVPSLVPMHQGLQYIHGVSSKIDGKIEFVVIQFDDCLYGFRTLSPISTATPLFAVPIVSIISIMPHEDSDCIALVITFSSQQQNSTENESVSIKCSSMNAFQYFSVLLQLWRKRLLTIKKMQIPLSLQSYNNPPASNPFSDFTSNNFHMQVPEEFEFVKSQKNSIKPIVFQKESTASPSTKSIPSSFLFSFDHLNNDRSFISTVTVLNSDAFSSISKYNGKFSTLEINKETINHNKSTVVSSSKRIPTLFSVNNPSSEGNLNTIVFSGEDKAPFRCGLPQMNDEYEIQQLVKLYQRKQGGEKETIVVYSNQTVTYRGMNLPQNDLYEMALLCPPPPSVELFRPFGVGDDDYDTLLPWDDEYLEKHPPPAMLPLKELFLSVGSDPSHSFTLRKPSTLNNSPILEMTKQTQSSNIILNHQQQQQQIEKKNDIPVSPSKPLLKDPPLFLAPSNSKMCAGRSLPQPLNIKPPQKSLLSPLGTGGSQLPQSQFNTNLLPPPKPQQITTHNLSPQIPSHNPTAASQPKYFPMPPSIPHPILAQKLSGNLPQASSPPFSPPNPFLSPNIQKISQFPAPQSSSQQSTSPLPLQQTSPQLPPPKTSPQLPPPNTSPQLPPPKTSPQLSPPNISPQLPPPQNFRLPPQSTSQILPQGSSPTLPASSSSIIAREQINNQLASITEKINQMKMNLQKKQEAQNQSSNPT